jgi:hypothetical protein
LDRFIFLKEECESVGEALKEALRHDYAPTQSEAFYNEFRGRLDYVLDQIRRDPAMTPKAVSAHMDSIAEIGSRVSLIERSHLGEFSWPFAEVIRGIAEKLFVEENLFADDAASRAQSPLIHVVSEGMDYKIFDDGLAGRTRRVLIVAFPRQLKHHVLLHAIFGHELGHPAAEIDHDNRRLAEGVMGHLCAGALADSEATLDWLRAVEVAGPTQGVVQPDQDIDDFMVRSWRKEIFCDLFGLKLFGPAFAAAHRTILEPTSNWPSRFNCSGSTHPPYPVRARLLARTMKAWKWELPVTEREGAVRDAEKAMLDYALGPHKESELDVIDDAQLEAVRDSLDEIFAPHLGMAYAPPSHDMLSTLVGRLGDARPPICQRVGDDGRPNNDRVPLQSCLYAGWTFWFGGKSLLAPAVAGQVGPDGLNFLTVNRLCEHAILQQHAIDSVLDWNGA